MLELGLFTLLVVAYGLVSGRLEGWPITGPMVFVSAGLVGSATGVLDGGVALIEEASGGEAGLLVSGEGVLTLAEIALVLVLFTDAMRLPLASLRGNAEVPGRLLLIGLPLTILAAGFAALVLFDDELVLWEAFLLAAIVAPTDAALGSAVVEDHALPARVRQSLNAESGLNDGLVVPLLTIFLALAVAEEEVTAVSAGQVIAEKIGWGLVVGVGLGAVAGVLMRLSISRGWMTGVFQELAIAATAVFAWWLAEEIGGSGFIAAFVGGLAAGHALRRLGDSVADFAEAAGQLLSLLVFFVFGMVAWELLDAVTWEHVAFAVLALTALRMVPVMLALIGSGLAGRSVAFIGWFGPRGLATIILAYIVVGEEPLLAGLETVVVAMTLTVLLSVFAHGITAAPLARRYARWCASLEPGSPELGEAPELPTRLEAVRRRRAADASDR